MGKVELSPTHEIREGLDVVWQIPANPKAVLYLAHGAGDTPFSYWPSHPNAPTCTGTPEHVVVTREALERGFAVFAGTAVASNKEWETWPPSSADVQNNKKILTAWRSEHGLQDLPLSAWGTSNGGDFVSCLAHEVKVHSLIVMVSHGSAEAFKSAVAGDYPPTLFVPMTKDEKTFSLVKENVAILRGKGIPSDIEGAPPEAVHPHFFAENIDELDEEQSAKLYSLFVQDGIISDDNFVKKALTKHEVKPYLRKAGISRTGDDSQHQQAEENAAGGDGERHGPRHGVHRGGHHRGPPSERGEAPEEGESNEAGGDGERHGPRHGGHRGGRRRGPPSERGEAPEEEESNEAGGDGEELNEAGGDGERHGPRHGGHRGGRRRGPPSERGEAPDEEESKEAGGDGEELNAAGGDGERRGPRHGGHRGGHRRGPPSERGEAPEEGESNEAGGDGERHGPRHEGHRGGRHRGPPSERGEVPDEEELKEADGDGEELKEAGGDGERHGNRHGGHRGGHRRGPPSERGEALGEEAGGDGEESKEAGADGERHRPKHGGHLGGHHRGPPFERGEAPPTGGRGGGRGPKRGHNGAPPSHSIADGVVNQLRVAEGQHTLTSRHDAAVFSWLEGEGWRNVQTQ